MNNETNLNSSQESTIVEDKEVLQASLNLVPKKEPVPKSKYKGVCFYRKNSKWAATALLNPDDQGKRKLKHIGYYLDDREAAIARNRYIEENGLVCRKTKIDD